MWKTVRKNITYRCESGVGCSVESHKYDKRKDSVEEQMKPHDIDL